MRRPVVPPANRRARRAQCWVWWRRRSATTDGTVVWQWRHCQRVRVVPSSRRRSRLLVSSAAQPRQRWTVRVMGVAGPSSRVAALSPGSGRGS